MEIVLFKDIFKFEKKSKIKAGDGLLLKEGKYPFFTSSNILSKSINEYQFDKESLIFGTGGLASIHYCNEKFSVSTDCFVTKVLDSNRAFTKFVYFFLSGNINILENGFKGAGLKHISKDYLQNIEIPLPSLAEQKAIAAKLDKAQEIINYNKEIIAKYDALTQSLFIDMFGDPVKNEKGWEKVKLGDICGIGSSKRVYVEELEENGIPFYRGTEVGSLGNEEIIHPTLFITKEHYERLKKETGIPQIGDLLMPSICPDGRIFQVKNNDAFYFKDGRVLWIKVNQTKINSVFLKKNLKVNFTKNYSKIASGTTFSELKIFALKDLIISNPPITLQNQFAERVSVIEAQKQLAQESLAKSQELFGSLLQQSFS